MKPSPSPTTLDRLEGLLATLLAAINGLVDALLPIIESVDNNPHRPWVERTRLGDRFWTIIRQLFALTARTAPESLAENPTFPPIPPRAPSQKCVKTLRAKHPTATLSPRQLAKRLAVLLHALLCLAAEANAALTPAFHHHAAQLRVIAGCNALPPQTWETTG